MASPETKICKGATIIGLDEGNIKFGYGCMIHPFSKIIAEGGSSIIFGDYNIIEEGVLIKACPKKNPKTGKEEPSSIYIGNYNHFKIGAHVENTSVQDYNIIDYKTKIVNGYIESQTIMTPMAEIKEGKILRKGAALLPKNKLMINNTFDEEAYKNNIKNLVGVLEHLFNLAMTKK